ncbi:hypothetical protein H4R99_004512 [Coemansia sp. RSA 1722]|nr:hypothetical protein LPJ57_005629 [Coemansia sp. RSA 486]KAJ2222881.1 hypothetical protein IWW45_008488 [Coemansia sp. RSA 485]KAJ2597327.1 hypothetical protein GGF39_003098 [Coemansia sp. RSA 1721]KAJ2597419.1 hypothetical protein H4R99_004512 [Coemansia sp. RSA 1722]KAJ2636110.1 hypothetical protein GGF40_003200 [Coemansia sp. RSA 1286]
MDYTFWTFVLLSVAALWYVFSMFVGRSRLHMRLARFRSQGRFSILDDALSGNDGSGFARDYRAGLSSRNFDIAINIEDGDSRPGLDSEEVRRIMEAQGVSFDKARLIRQQQLMQRNGIDPSTGMPLDPKAVTFGK